MNETGAIESHALIININHYVEILLYICAFYLFGFSLENLLFKKAN